MNTKKIHPYIYIILTFIAVIMIGTILLVLPISSSSGKSIGFVNSLFMSTSSVCVTGLSVLKGGLGSDLSLFGKIVMVFLMEIGGLSFITIAVFFFTILGAKIGVSNKFLLRESLNQNSLKGITSLVIKIITISFIIQGIGVLVNLFPIYEYVKLTYKGSGVNNLFKSLGISVFHAVASFNNAGFDIFGTSNSMEIFSESSDLISVSSKVILNSTTMLLIILGGIGFVVLTDMFKNKKWKKINLHTKITLISTVVLILLGTFLIKITSNIGIFDSIFMSVSTRTAGFSVYNLENLKNYPACYVVFIILMMIGASPCSTGGGIKTTTIAIIFIAIIYFAKGKKSKAFHRRIPTDQIVKAFILAFIAFSIVFMGTFIVCAIQPDLGFENVLFECVSAFSTSGLSMGITTSLNSFNKIIICILMFLGRIGPLTVIGVVNKNWMNDLNEDIKYVEERVIIG